MVDQPSGARRKRGLRFGFASTTGIVVAGQALSLLVTLVVTPIQLERMGLTSYGLLALAVSSATVLSFVDYGLGWAALYFIPRTQEGSGLGPTIARLRRWALLLAVPTAVVSLVVLALAAPDSDTELLLLTALLAGTTLLTNCLYSLVRALGQYLIPTLLATTVVVSTNVFWALVASRPDAVALVLLWMICSNFVASVAMSLFVRRCYSANSDAAEEGPSPGMGLAASRAMLFGLAAALIGSGDKVVVGAALGSAALASYSIAVSLTSRVTILTSSATAVLLPEWSRSHKFEGDKEMTRSLLRATTATASITAVVTAGLFYAAPAFLDVWISPDFSDGVAMAVRFLAIGFGVYGLGSLGFAGNDARGGVSRSTLVAVPLAVATLALMVPAAWVGGVTGAAVAFSVGISLYGLSGLLLAGVLGVDFLRSSAANIVMPFAAGLPVLLLASLANSPWVTIISVALVEAVVLLWQVRRLRLSTREVSDPPPLVNE